MRNGSSSRISRIFAAVRALPYFSLDDLASLETDKTYLKILFSRYQKSGRVVRLKKGLYVTKDYLDQTEKAGRLTAYAEFLANLLVPASYLSLDYVLYENHLLTEIPTHYTSVTAGKTNAFRNQLGHFYYHKIKDGLFTGFGIEKRAFFDVFRATKAKALFDYLYFRKNQLPNQKAVKALRLNLDTISSKDQQNLENYVSLEKSPKMGLIYSWLFKA